MKKILTTLAFSLAIFAANAQNNEVIKIGMKAPELAYNNPEGKKLKLSEINKGSYVLLDFWASWCGPCRRSNPGLVKMYKEYSAKTLKGTKKGLTIVSVSLDKSKDAWVNAIKMDNLSWPYHMSDLGYWQSQAAATYGIQSIPQAFLIDPQGKIVGAYQAAEEAEGDIRKLAQ
jgi:thiol-disulfide isomerase/thioredoxin